ncbi:MAG: hypothetical protein ABI480_16325 [Chitinophagaceae bacterium]
MKSILVICLGLIILSCKSTHVSTYTAKPTICIVDGTPSNIDVLNSIPDSLKKKYNFISFNRPGYGGTENAVMSPELLFQLAKKAGLHENDYGIIGISGGGPYSILLASKFKLKHCGIVSGMVSRDAYFKFADSAITRGVMEGVLQGYDKFAAAAMNFPNLDEILRHAGTTSKEIAIRACYDDLNFVLADALYDAIKNKNIKIDWWHGANDVNVPVKSVELFIKDYKNARLNIIPLATHGIDSRVYIGKLIDDWELR